MPLYKSPSNCIVYYDAASKMWRMNSKEDFETFYCSAQAASVSEPPSRGWELPDEERGI
eukprot:CAMPEP_0197678988 /NCGR_PEP_ID=MMETSP1338-20131121/90946_1 /TAXON_ID=43686 ORGANISM="Pelagodinium beii, Strain RCC1491" /NCGR_SAMPLE_ID=MMETSP1338 /ASSEMBLY_ACC=CAM_ASM_000754 /LENGTH=58 /DNA_ID=CAMNT_0043259989 /DNA_START=1 /DNA_END=174 /DNA_ORIENTATION=+